VSYNFVTSNGTLKEYPENLTSNRASIEGKLIGCLASDLSLFLNCSGIKASSMLTEEGKTLFAVLHKVYEKGASEVDLSIIDTVLSDSQVLRSEFIKCNGYQAIKNLEKEISQTNFDTYLSDFSTSNSALETYKLTVELQEKLESMTKIMNQDELSSYVDYKVNEIRKNNVADTGVQTISITDQFLQDLREKKKMGTPYDGLRTISNTTLGLHMSNFSLLTSVTNSGKAQPLDAKVLTRDGFKEMRELKVGTEIYGEDGKLYKVKNIMPQGKLRAFKVKFSDGAETICNDKHLWNVSDSERKKYQTRELRDIMNIKYTNRYIQKNNPIEFDKKELPIPPYLLGVLIADGHLSGNTVTFSTDEEYIVNKVKSLIPEDYHVKKQKGDNYGYSIKHNDHLRNKNILNQHIKAMGLKVKSYDKFIPKEYLYASKEDRLELLRGLFDCDGCASKTISNLMYTTTSTRLKDDMIWLCRSLGYSVKYGVDPRSEKYTSGVCYNISIKHVAGQDRFFTSPKHTSRYKESNKYLEQRHHFKEIIDLGYDVEMQCIETTNPSGLYITDDFIVTHNSTIMFNQIAMSFVDLGEPVLLYCNESEEHQIQELLLVRTLCLKFNYWKLNRNDLSKGEFSPEQEIMIEKARQYVDEHYKDKILFKKANKYTVSEFLSIVRRYAYRGVRHVFLDTYKSENPSSDNVRGELIDSSRRIYETCRTLDINCFATYQTALRHKEVQKRGLDESILSEAKSIAEVLDIILACRQLYDNEYTGEKYDVKPYKWKMNDDGKGYHQEYITLDPTKKYLVMNIAKSRYGEKNVAVLYEMNYTWGLLKEIGQCYVHID
jgi:replicative DNA helicase